MTDRRMFLKSLAGATAGLTLTSAAHTAPDDRDRLGEILPTGPYKSICHHARHRRLPRWLDH